MDKFFEVLGHSLEKLDPGTAVAILILLIVLYGAWKTIQFLYNLLSNKDKEVDELHKVNKEDSDANIKLIMQLSSNLDKHLIQGDETRSLVLEMKRTLEELKIKWEIYFKTNK